MMPTIFYTGTADTVGLTENASHNSNTHGTGCTLSSAISSNLAKGYDLDTAVERAKAYISGALGAMLDLGKGSGPMDHGFDFREKDLRRNAYDNDREAFGSHKGDLGWLQ